MPVTTRRQRKLAAPSLLNLPVETLEAICEDTFSGEGARTGPICKALLPLQRRQYTSLLIPAKTKASHLKQLLPSLVKLERLHLVGRGDVVELLAAIPHPEKLRELVLEDCKLKPKEQAYAQAQAALNTSLQTLSALETFSLDSPYKVVEGASGGEGDFAFSSFPSSLSSLPLKHLTLGADVRISASELLSLLDDLSASLEKLTLDFFDGEEGGRGHKFDRWREFLGSWELPDWREDFNYEDLLEVFDKAKELSVKVDGRAVWAAAVEADFKAEKECFWAEQEELRADRDRFGGGYGGYGGYRGRWNRW
ncbi:hypothetical protein JCM10213_000361 [Rhodosporidiobolus nylandii]